MLVLHRGGPHIRGSEQVLLDILRSLKGSEYHPVVLCSNAVLVQAIAPLGIEVHVTAFPEIIVWSREWRTPLLRYARAFLRLRRTCVERGVDLLLCSGGGPCQLAVPVAKSLGVSLVCLLHHPAPRLYERWWLLHRAPTIVFPSRYTAAHTYGEIGRSGQVVYPGIDADHFRPAAPRNMEIRRRLGIDPGEVVFAQLGALDPHKGHDLLVRAFAAALPRLPAARLLIVGAGPEAEAVRALVDELGLAGRVLLTGFVDDMLPYLQHVIDVNVLASSEEGLGLVNLEASACELPNIGTNCTGIVETILDGMTGFLVHGSDEAFAEAMVRLATDPALRRTMGSNGREFVLREFSPARFGAEMLDVMRSACRRTRSPRSS